MRQFQMNGIESARAMRDPSMRAHFLQMAFLEVVPQNILEQMRERVRADIYKQDQEQLMTLLPL